MAHFLGRKIFQSRNLIFPLTAAPKYPLLMMADAMIVVARVILILALVPEENRVAKISWLHLVRTTPAGAIDLNLVAWLPHKPSGPRRRIAHQFLRS
jgi:hypothetical protein